MESIAKIDELYKKFGGPPDLNPNVPGFDINVFNDEMKKQVGYTFRNRAKGMSDQVNGSNLIRASKNKHASTLR